MSRTSDLLKDEKQATPRRGLGAGTNSTSRPQAFGDTLTVPSFSLPQDSESADMDIKPRSPADRSCEEILEELKFQFLIFKSDAYNKYYLIFIYLNLAAAFKKDNGNNRILLVQYRQKLSTYVSLALANIKAQQKISFNPKKNGIFNNNALKTLNEEKKTFIELLTRVKTLIP